MANNDIQLCRASVIADDWVVKGFHIEIDGIELAMRPAHQTGVIALRSVFSSVSSDNLNAAANKLIRQCLENPGVRDRWCDVIDKAIGYLRGYYGEVSDLAIGRQAELIFLRHAIRKYSEAVM